MIQSVNSTHALQSEQQITPAASQPQAKSSDVQDRVTLTSTGGDKDHDGDSA